MLFRSSAGSSLVRRSRSPDAVEQRHLVQLVALVAEARRPLSAGKIQREHFAAIDRKQFDRWVAGLERAGVIATAEAAFTADDGELRRYRTVELADASGTWLSRVELEQEIAPFGTATLAANVTQALRAFYALAPQAGLVKESADTQARRGTAPHWIERPDGGVYSHFYPIRALEHERDGQVVLDCQVGADGHLSCAVAQESPQGWGFGAAALQIARSFQMAPTPTWWTMMVAPYYIGMRMAVTNFHQHSHYL